MIPRIGASITRYGTAVLRQFELMGTLHAELVRRDRARARQAALPPVAGGAGDRPADRRCSATTPTTPIDLLSMLGPPPHVIKLNEGTQGAGVMLTEKPSASRSVIEALRGLYANFLVQEFIAEAKGADLRCFVVGGEVVAAMRRQAPKGDFRSNLHRGGSAKAVRASEAEQAGRGARGAGAGAGRGRRRPDPLQARPAGAGGQFLARAGRHRGRDRRRHRRRGSSTTWSSGHLPAVRRRGPRREGVCYEVLTNLDGRFRDAFNSGLIALPRSLAGPQFCFQSTRSLGSIGTADYGNRGTSLGPGAVSAPGPVLFAGDGARGDSRAPVQESPIRTSAGTAIAASEAHATAAGCSTARVDGTLVRQPPTGSAGCASSS